MSRKRCQRRRPAAAAVCKCVDLEFSTPEHFLAHIAQDGVHSVARAAVTGIEDVLRQVAGVAVLAAPQRPQEVAAADSGNVPANETQQLQITPPGISTCRAYRTVSPACHQRCATALRRQRRLSQSHSLRMVDSTACMAAQQALNKGGASTRTSGGSPTAHPIVVLA